MGHLRLCCVNFMAQFHTLHKRFIHYHVPFNKVVKHSFCQTASIDCAQFLETTQKSKKRQCKQHHVIGSKDFPISSLLKHSVSGLCLTNTICKPHSVWNRVFLTVYTCKAAGTVAPVCKSIKASYSEAHRVLYQMERTKKNHKN